MVPASVTIAEALSRGVMIEGWRPERGERGRDSIRPGVALFIRLVGPELTRMHV